MTHYRMDVDAPIGRLTLAASEEALVAVRLPGTRELALGATDGGGHPLLERAAGELREYFAGRRRAFDLPLAPQGTPFERAVWAELVAIPFGETRSYSGLARALGRPRAARAVGAANGKNPIAVVVPCHRVVGADGSLTGYAGGEAMKRWLLDHERRAAGRSRGADAELFP